MPVPDKTSPPSDGRHGSTFSVALAKDVFLLLLVLLLRFLLLLLFWRLLLAGICRGLAVSVVFILDLGYVTTLNSLEWRLSRRAPCPASSVGTAGDALGRQSGPGRAWEGRPAACGLVALADPDAHGEPRGPPDGRITGQFFSDSEIFCSWRTDANVRVQDFVECFNVTSVLFSILFGIALKSIVACAGPGNANRRRLVVLSECSEPLRLIVSVSPCGWDFVNAHDADLELHHRTASFHLKP